MNRVLKLGLIQIELLKSINKLGLIGKNLPIPAYNDNSIIEHRKLESQIIAHLIHKDKNLKVLFR